MALAQAMLSAGASCTVGFVLFLGAQGWRSQRTRRGVELGLLLPNMIPPLFVVMGVLSWVTGWMKFPYGLGAVVLTHALMNAGLIAVALERLVLHRLGGAVEMAWTLGASRVRFWLEIGIPLLKQDLLCLFLFVFGISFTSFSVPLLLAGERTLTLETAILNLIRLEGRWDAAVILAAIQALSLLALSWMLPRGFWPGRAVMRSGSYLGVRALRFSVFLPLLWIVGGWSVGALQAGWRQFPQDLPLVEAFLTTLAIGCGVGFLHLILFLVMAYVLPHEGLVRVMNGYLAPSTVITGFAFLLLPGEGDVMRLLKVILGISLISFPLLYRWMVHSAIASVSAHVQAARLMGASWSRILFEIVWPQVASQVLRASGLAALWAIGDFAMTGIIAGNLQTVPLLMEDLLGNYRIESAQLLMLPLLFVGLSVYAIFVWSSRYVRG